MNNNQVISLDMWLYTFIFKLLPCMVLTIGGFRKCAKNILKEGTLQFHMTCHVKCHVKCHVTNFRELNPKLHKSCFLV